MKIIETPSFTKHVNEILSDDEYSLLQNTLVLRPDLGKLIQRISRKRIKMNDKLFQELLESVKQGGEIIRGEKKGSRVFEFKNPNVKSIRLKYGLSQTKFAQLLGISPATLRNWEQGRRKPEGPARVLLLIAEKHPEAILDSVYQVAK